MELTKILAEEKKKKKLKGLLYLNPQSYTYKVFLQSAKKGTAPGTNLWISLFLS